MGINFNKLMPTSLDKIMAFGVNGGEYKWVLDELSAAAINNTQENTNLTGKGGRTIGLLKRNKAVTVTGTNGMMSIGAIGTSTGSDVEFNVTVTPMIPDFITVGGTIDAPTGTTQKKAYGTVGNEISKVFVLDENGVTKNKLTQGASAAKGTFTYNPTNKTITFFKGDVKPEDKIVAYYKYEVKDSARVSNVSDKYSEIVTLYIDATVQDECHNEYHAQYYIPYADFTGNFNMQFGSDQSNFEFEASSLPQTCGGTSALFWDMIVFGETEET